MENLTGASLHLRGGATRKSEQQNAQRIGSAADQMRHSVGKRVGFARARPRDDQQRRTAAPRLIAPVFDGKALFGVENVEIVMRGSARVAVKRYLRGGFVLSTRHGEPRTNVR